MPGPATVSKNISGFDPRSVTGCQLWLDAADSSSVTGTTTVTAWRDKSGNARNLSVGSGTTSYASNAITLASSYMVVTSAVDLTNFTFFIVSKSNGAISNQTVFGARPNTSAVYNSTDGFGFYMDNQTAIRLYGTTASGATLVSFAAGTSVANVFSFQSGSTIINGWLNGTSLTAANSLGTRTSTAQGFAIGGEWQGSAYGNIISTASINEIIVYNTTLSTSQRQAIEGYLAWKWGIETVSTRNLVVGHPFYYNRPFTRDFQPVDIPNCSMWLDGKDTSTMTPSNPSSGTSITAWRDKSSNSVSYVNGGAGIIPNFSAYSLAAPTYASGGGILFNPSLSGTFTNGTTQGFVAVGGFPLNISGFTAIVIARANGTTISSYNSYFSWYSSTPSEFLDFDANGGAGYTSISADGAGLADYQTNYTLTNAVTIQCLQGTTTGASTYINGSVTPISTYSWSFSQTSNPLAIDVWIGNQAPGNRTFSGTIYEMVLYNTALTLAQRQQVEGYLAWKWGIRTTLPATHPFYTYPPSSALPFTPTSILGCQLWIDAAQDTSANNATITTIPDRSGNGSNLTAIGTITFYQNYRNGNPVYYFGGSRASNANFNWGTSFTHIVVSSSGSGGWLNSAGTLTTYVGLGNWALVNVNSSVSFEDPGSITTWNISGSVTTGVNANGLPYVTLPVSTTSGSATSTYTTPINSVRQTSFSIVLPSTAGLYSYFGLTNGTTTLQFLLNTSGGVPSQIYFFFGGNPTLNASAGSTVLCTVTNTSLYMIVYPSGSNVTVSWTNSGAAEYYMFFNVIGNGANANTTTYFNIQFDPAQGASILPKTTGLANAWNITSMGYTSGSTTLTNYAVNGTTRSSWTSTSYSGITPVLPLYINGSSTGAYDTTYYAEIIHYNIALTTIQRQQVEGYLAAKWNISLPSTHQYKLFPPSQFTPINTIASGGTITITPSVKYHTFTSSGSFVFTSGVTTLNYLIVGGGGGGGDRHGGGGGAGGVISGTFSPTATTYTVTVGLGGAGGYYEGNNSSPRGSGLKGGDSSISGVATAYGGGGGGTYDGNPTGTFGSGGGGGGNNLAGIAGTTGQGNSGGSGLLPGAGGGGGAGGAGVNANTGTGGVGTTNYTSQLLAIGYGTSFAVATSPNSVVVSGIAYIAGGGGGAAAAGPGPGGTGGLGGGGRGDWDIAYISGGTANTGGGGGGSRSLNEPSYGYAGGSGLVVIWYSA